MTQHVREVLQDSLRRYGGALGIMACAVGLRFLLDSLLESAGFAIFLVAMLTAAWVGGLGPSLIAQTGLLFVSAFFFAEAPSSPPPSREKAIAGVIAYFAVGSVVGWLSERNRAARRRAAARDVELETERKRLRATVSCMGDGVLVVDRQGRLTLMNAAAERATGWSAGESLGRPLGELFPVWRVPLVTPAESPAQRVLRERLPHRADNLMLSTRQQKMLPVAYSAAPVLNAKGELTGAVVVFRDETERKQAEESLREADRRKDEFLATLAHELRNPLAPIRTGLELLRIGALDGPDMQEVREMMVRQTEQMVRLIDDLLDVSRITRGKLRLRRTIVDLNEVVRNAVDNARPHLDKAQHTLRVDVPRETVRLDADGNRLTQVLANLLHNAAKYTPPGGQIDVCASVSERNLELAVIDNGIGIPPENRQRIFEMFAQSTDASQGQSGLGIGLALAKSLIELHGGSIEVDSPGTNGGSTFRVRLPVIAEFPPSPVDASVEEAASRSAGKRILVVDDNEDARDSLALMVRLIGNEVRVASDGIEAFEVAEGFRPHVVLMDLGMPRLDGCGAARRIRGEPWGGDVLLVATTGWGQDDDRRRTYEAGFDHHLVKPIDPAAVQRILRTLDDTPWVPSGREALRTRPAASSGSSAPSGTRAAANH